MGRGATEILYATLTHARRGRSLGWRRRSALRLLAVIARNAYIAAEVTLDAAPSL